MNMRHGVAAAMMAMAVVACSTGEPAVTADATRELASEVAPSETAPPSSLDVVVIAGEQFVPESDGCPGLADLDIGPGSRVEVTDRDDALLGAGTLGPGRPIEAPGPDGQPVEGAAFCEFSLTVDLAEASDAITVAVAGHDPVRFTSTELAAAGEAVVRLGAVTADPELVAQAQEESDYAAIVAMLQRRITGDFEQLVRVMADTNYEQPYTFEECWGALAGTPHPQTGLFDNYEADVTWERETLQATPDWEIAGGRLAGTAPDGRLYEMHTTFTERIDGQQLAPSEGMRHYAVIDGEAFGFYECR